MCLFLYCTDYYTVWCIFTDGCTFSEFFCVIGEPTMLETGLASHSMASCHGLRTTRSVNCHIVKKTDGGRQIICYSQLYDSISYVFMYDWLECKLFVFRIRRKLIPQNLSRHGGVWWRREKMCFLSAQWTHPSLT